MNKTLRIAMREFASTVLTKGFIVGVLMTPVIMLVVIGAIALVKSLPGPKVAGSVAVIDHSGLASDLVVQRFTPEAIEREQEEDRDRVQKQAEKAMDQFGLDDAHKQQAREMTGAAAQHAKRVTMDVTVSPLPATADVEAIKAEVRDANLRDAGTGEAAERQTLALAIIPKEAVVPAAGGGDGGAEYGGFQVFVAPKLDFEVQETIVRRIRDSIVDARIASNEKLRSVGLGARDVRAIVQRPEAETKAVTSRGEQKTSELAAFLVPAGFMILLLISVMSGGQYLMTTTIEEKSSRVMEILLSAVSPMQLMTGKILGQMAASLLILMVYSGLGIVSLLYFSMEYLLNPMNVVYLVVFFFVAFFIVASLMAAIGSAVTELREAQTLMTPVMLIIMLPWLLWMPISRAPNSLFSTIMSFVPILNPFVMVIRLSGSEPVPAWQVPVSIGVGIASAAIAAWAAAKVFRIGILMYGKPPNFATLIRWIRMA